MCIKGKEAYLSGMGTPAPRSIMTMKEEACMIHIRDHVDCVELFCAKLPYGARYKSAKLLKL